MEGALALASSPSRKAIFGRRDRDVKWDVRWFLLTDVALTYYTSEVEARAGAPPKRSLDVAGGTAVVDGEPATLTFQCGEEVLHIRTPDWMLRSGERVLKAWADAIMAVTHTTSRPARPAAMPELADPSSRNTQESGPHSPSSETRGDTAIDPSAASRDGVVSSCSHDDCSSTPSTGLVNAEPTGSGRPSAAKNWAVCRCWTLSLVKSQDEALGMGIWLNDVDQYLVVTEVAPGGLAANAGIRPRDLVTRVNGLQTTPELVQAIAKSDGVIQLEVRRFQRQADQGDVATDASAPKKLREDVELKKALEQSEMEEAIQRSLSLERKRALEHSKEERALRLALIRSQQEVGDSSAHVDVAEDADEEAQLLETALAESLITAQLHQASSGSIQSAEVEADGAGSAVAQLEEQFARTGTMRSRRGAERAPRQTQGAQEGAQSAKCADEGVYEAQHHFVLQELTSPSIAAYLAADWDDESEAGDENCEALRRESRML